ncbi:MAG: hypothetical protein LBT05_02790 [Planctomycetaceae bacterium]|jgi:hypothetical protein|nr:hypothetical protein [Planctomycetaceae bacterium]
MSCWQTLLVDSKENQKFLQTANDAGRSLAMWQTWGERRRLQFEAVRYPYQSALHWAYLSPETKTLWEQRNSSNAEKPPYFLFGAREYDAVSTLEFATSLLKQTATLEPQEWTERFLSLINHLAKISDGELSLEKSPLLHQLYSAELSWLIACLFPDLKDGRRLLETARDNFRLGLTETLDGAGLPNASDYFLLRPLLACWTRALILGKQAKMRPYPPDVHRQLEWAALHALRFMRKDGSPIFTKHEPFDKESLIAMLQYTLAFDSDENDHAVARSLFPNKFSARKIAKIRLSLMQNPAASKSAPPPTEKAAREKTPVKAADSEPAYFSEWSQLAALRSGWGFREPSLAVAYAPLNTFQRATDAPQNIWTDQSVTTELNVAEQTVWSGVWDVAVRLDGRLLTPIDSWSMTCEIINEYANYLEIEIPLAENMRLQRHFLLCRKEKLLLTADSILPIFEDDADEGEEYDGFDDPKYNVEYESRLPLTCGIYVEKTAADANELLLTEIEQPLTRVFPLAFSEWKDAEQSDNIAGELYVEENKTKGIASQADFLIFRQKTFGRAMFAPLLFDLNAKRFQEPYTWRQLTVGENLERVSRDRAAAFRVQINQLHVLFYRTLTSPLNRTFFGHNLVGDFFAGRFDVKTGKVTTLVEAEQE